MDPENLCSSYNRVLIFGICESVVIWQEPVIDRRQLSELRVQQMKEMLIDVSMKAFHGLSARLLYMEMIAFTIVWH